MEHEQSTDSLYWKIAAGAGLALAGALGVGWWRAAKASPNLPAGASTPEVVEASVYRGFSYRVELLPWRDGQLHVATLPAQQVGQAGLERDDVAALLGLDQARKWVQQRVDKLLGPELKATFSVAVGG